MRSAICVPYTVGRRVPAMLKLGAFRNEHTQEFDSWIHGKRKCPLQVGGRGRDRTGDPLLAKIARAKNQ
jgi:hypothetical protein